MFWVVVWCIDLLLEIGAETKLSVHCVVGVGIRGRPMVNGSRLTALPRRGIASGVCPP
jgi:hypothetical protein